MEIIEQSISEFEDRSTDITQFELEWKTTENRQTTHIFRDCATITKCLTSMTLEFQKGRRKSVVLGEYFKEIIAENISLLVKHINSQILQAQWIPNKINPFKKSWCSYIFFHSVPFLSHLVFATFHTRCHHFSPNSLLGASHKLFLTLPPLFLTIYHGSPTDNLQRQKASSVRTEER